jgi:hypothetical protein
VAIGLNAQGVQEQFLWGIFQNEKESPISAAPARSKMPENPHKI